MQDASKNEHVRGALQVIINAVNVQNSIRKPWLQQAEKGAEFFGSHIMFVAGLLPPSDEKYAPEALEPIVGIQRHLNRLLTPVLDGSLGGKDHYRRIKGVTAAYNAVVAFRQAFPSADIAPTTVGVDIQHNVDMTVSIPAADDNPPYTLDVSLESTNAEYITYFPIRNEDEIATRIPHFKRTEDLRNAMNYVNGKDDPFEFLLVVNAPNEIADTSTLQDKAEDMRTQLNSYMKRITQEPIQPDFIEQIVTTPQDAPTDDRGDAYAVAQQLTIEAYTPPIHPDALKLGLYDTGKLGTSAAMAEMRELLGLGPEISEIAVYSTVVEIVTRHPALQSITWTRNGGLVGAAWRNEIRPAVEDYIAFKEVQRGLTERENQTQIHKEDTPTVRKDLQQTTQTSKELRSEIIPPEIKPLDGEQKSASQIIAAPVDLLQTRAVREDWRNHPLWYSLTDNQRSAVDFFAQEYQEQAGGLVEAYRRILDGYQQHPKVLAIRNPDKRSYGSIQTSHTGHFDRSFNNLIKKIFGKKKSF